MHRLMEHTIFRRREVAIIPNSELAILYCLVHDRKIDIFHAIALKLKDVAQKFNVAIKIGVLVTAFLWYVGFDIDKMPFERVKGRESVDIVMMQAIGIVQNTINGFRLTPLPGEPQPQ